MAPVFSPANILAYYVHDAAHSFNNDDVLDGDDDDDDDHSSRCGTATRPPVAERRPPPLSPLPPSATLRPAQEISRPQPADRARSVAPCFFRFVLKS